MIAKPLKDVGDMIVSLTMSTNKKGRCDSRSHMTLTRERDWDNLYTMCYLFK